jgi:DNA-binding IclR family transcriptional regulator
VGIEDEGTVRSVSRALEILAFIAGHPEGINLKETVQATGLPKTTVLRQLQTLEANGLVWKASSQAYILGPTLLHLATQSLDAWRMPPSLTEKLEGLADQCNETVNLWVRRGLNRVLVAQAHGRQTLRNVARLGDQLPLDAGASSKVLLTAMPDVFIHEVAMLSSHGPEQLETIRSWVAETHEKGWAVSHGEREEGLSAVGVPVCSAKGATVAALTLSGPTSRFTPERIESYVDRLKACADEIGRQGFAPQL